jgi:hypothetical protein
MQDIKHDNNDSLTKPKKPRSQKQIESFEKAMRLWKENIEKRKEEKLLQSAKLLLEKNELPIKNIPKTNKVVYQSSSSEKEESSSEEEEEVIVVKSKPKSKAKTKKKPQRKTIIFESSSEESSSDEEEEEKYIALPKSKSRIKRSEPEYNLPPPIEHKNPQDFRVYFI